MGLTKNHSSIFVHLFSILIIITIISSSLLFTAFPISSTYLHKSIIDKSGPHIFNSKSKSTFDLNSKIASLNNLNSSLNYLFKSISHYTITDIAVDSTGNEYLTGYTNTNNLITKNAFKDTFSGGIDVFIAKFNPEDQMIFSTYFGGNGSDISSSIAVDPAGNIYVAGTTYSSNLLTKNAYFSTYKGNGDIFIVKIGSNGGLIFSTYLGGSKLDSATSIAVDRSGNSYITGFTSSNDFPTKNGFNTFYSGNKDAFVAKFNDIGGLVFSTYLGGSASDSATSIAVDNSGNSFVTGSTSSNDFPTKNAFNDTFSGITDAFIAKFNGIGSLVFSTYLGGSDFDYGYKIVVAVSGNFYITGITYSKNFPTKNNIYSSSGYPDHVFVSKFSDKGELLLSSAIQLPNINFDVYSKLIINIDSKGNFYVVGKSIFNSNTIFFKFDHLGKVISRIYLSGQFYIKGNGISVDKNGNTYITGDFEKFSINNTNIAVPNNSFNRTFVNSIDIFVLKLNSEGKKLFITYLGGSGFDNSSSIAVDSEGNIYVTGSTNSSNFPTKNAFNSSYSSNTDAFITKLNSTGGLVFSSYFGGTLMDIGNSIAVDSAGFSYVTGITYSRDFPTKNAYSDKFGSGADAFVAKFNITGGLVFSTYLGGSGSASGNGIAVDLFGNIYVTGLTHSSDFPTKNAYASYLKGASDAFITKFDGSGNISFSTYFGGYGDENGLSIAVDSEGNSYVTGTTTSVDLPTKQAFDSTYGGNTDAFVAKFNSTGGLVFSSYLGGSNTDESYSIALGPNDDCFVTGTTTSTDFFGGNNFTNTVSGRTDAFVIKINSTGNLIFNIRIGNGEAILPLEITVNGNGYSYVVGSTTSSIFPTKNTNNINPTGGTNAFLTEVNSSGSVVFSEYLGDLFLQNGNIISISKSVGTHQMFQTWLVLSLAILVVFGIGLYIGNEYRKYLKLKKNLHKDLKFSFITYFKSKFTISKKKISSTPHLSDEVFEKLEEIENENKIN